MNKLLWLEHAIMELKGVERLGIVFNLDTSLADLELDSLDIVELQMTYEDTVGYDTPDDTPEAFTTVRDLLTLMV